VKPNWTVNFKKKACSKSGKDVVFDEINKQYGAPKIYQYTATDKQRLGFEDEDFERYVKRTFKSLKGWDK